MASSTYTLTSSYLGSSIPANLPHAISVSLPKWQDNVDYEEGKSRVLDSMQTGYPRFFIHRSIQKLAGICEQKFGAYNERSMLFPTLKTAQACKSFMLAQAKSPIPVRLAHFVLCPPVGPSSAVQAGDCTELHIVLYPADAFPLAKSFWQHTGLGISSRMAERCLSLWADSMDVGSHEEHADGTSPSLINKRRSFRGRYGKKPSLGSPLTPLHSPPPQSPDGQSPPRLGSPTSPSQTTADDLGNEQSVYLEERYGRNLPLAAAGHAKVALRRRIAGTLSEEGGEHAGMEVAGRGVEGVTEDDVWLFPTGMSAIWYAHQLALAARPAAKSVCFGFPYTDTLKILQKWGPGCHFYGHGLDFDLDALEARLDTSEPILALFCEFPSNPLLRSPDLKRLRRLADKHDFLLVVDETIGSFVNIEVLPYVDILVSSLSKVFSGEVNVMGGSLVLNTNSRHYDSLKKIFETVYEDTYWPEDAIFMERNSRNFVPRVYVINENTEAVCDFLESKIGSSVIKSVLYPKFETSEHYEACRIPQRGDRPAGGFGGLFSVIFTSELAGRAFFDALPCEKGPSLGTNFTLACPYTVLAHYTELDWAAEYGVEASLVRVSVGLEERQSLLRGFAQALEAAEEAVRTQA